MGFYDYTGSEWGYEDRPYKPGQPVDVGPPRHKWTCSICGEKFDFYSSYNRHWWTHTAEERDHSGPAPFSGYDKPPGGNGGDDDQKPWEETEYAKGISGSLYDLLTKYMNPEEWGYSPETINRMYAMQQEKAETASGITGRRFLENLARSGPGMLKSGYRSWGEKEIGESLEETLSGIMNKILVESEQRKLAGGSEFMSKALQFLASERGYPIEQGKLLAMFMSLLTGQ